jgi:hypothetical protein
LNEDMLLALVCAAHDAKTVLIPWSTRSETVEVPLLHAACAAGHVKLVDKLLADGHCPACDTGSQESYTSAKYPTALHFAVAFGHADVVRCFGKTSPAIAHKLVNQVVYTGFTLPCMSGYASFSPLHVAVHSKDANRAISCARALLAMGAEVTSTDGAGETPIECAVSHGATGVAEWMICEGVPSEKLAGSDNLKSDILVALFQGHDTELLARAATSLDPNAEAARFFLGRRTKYRDVAHTIRHKGRSLVSWFAETYGARQLLGPATLEAKAFFLKLLALASDADLVPKVAGLVDFDAALPNKYKSWDTTALATTVFARTDDAAATRCADALHNHGAVMVPLAACEEAQGRGFSMLANTLRRIHAGLDEPAKKAARTIAYPITDGRVKNLEAMGFDTERCVLALEQASGDVQRAAEILLG